MKKMVPYLFLLPVLSVVGSVTLFLFSYNGVLSFTEIRLFTPKWTFSLDNYTSFLTRTEFLDITLYTIIWVAASVFFQCLFGFLIALVLDQTFKGRALVRAVVILPWVLPGVVVGLMWKWLFQVDYGLINIVLQNLKLINSPLQWLSTETLAKIAVIIVNIWKGTPFYALLLLAGLQNVPLDEVEAAQLDGANSFQRVRYVVIPHLKRLVITLTILQSIWTFNSFDLIFSLTQGGPVFSTTTFPVGVYRICFLYNRFGEATSIGMIGIIILVLLISPLLIWLGKQEG